jgi:hypothetical protein
MARKSTRRAFLDRKSDVYAANQDTWRRNERRFVGGSLVLDDLPRFPYEVGPRSAHYLARQLAATYLNFPADFAEIMAGELMAKAPQPANGINWGEGMGDYRPISQREGDTSLAEAMHDNLDGVGSQGSAWDPFWTRSHMETYPFGYLFQFAEAPDEPAGNRRREIEDNLRPYLRNFTPLQVTDHYAERGLFQYAIVRVPVRQDGKTRSGYYVLTREGWDGWNEENDDIPWDEGGWALLDADKNLLDREVWEDELAGEIPLWIYYYQRARGTIDFPMIGRPAITELAATAVSYMGISSAADFDFLEAAASILYIIGADKKVSAEVIAQREAGSSVIGVPRPKNRTDADVALHDGSTGAVTAEVAEKRLERKLLEAREIMRREATSTPDSSGESKKAGYRESKAPRLAMHAAEAESAMTNAVHWLARRSGIAKPTGFVSFTRDFDLTPVRDRIDEYFETRNKSKMKARTADVAAFVSLVKETLGMTDEKDLAKVRAEAE